MCIGIYRPIAVCSVSVVLMKAFGGRNVYRSHCFKSIEEHNRAIRGRVNLLFAYAYFAF